MKTDSRDKPKELGKGHGRNLIFYGLDLGGGVVRGRGLFRVVWVCLSGLVTTKEAFGLGSVGDGGLFV